MPARKRRKPGGAPPQSSFDLSTRSGRRAAQQAEAQTFATRRQVEKDDERARARAHREAAERENRRRELGQAKDRAAGRLKDVRRRGGRPEQRVAAEAEYRAALDAVLRDEQGLPPLSEEEARAEPGGRGTSEPPPGETGADRPDDGS